MTRKILAKTDQVHDCPIFKAGDVMAFSLPELLLDESDAVCAIAVSDLLPWSIKLAAGGVPNDNVLLCRGCRGGRAQAGFALEVLGEVKHDPQRTKKLVSLRSIPLFATLPERQMGKIEPMIREVEYAPGEEIITFGEPGRALNILTRGQVAVLKPDEGGEEKLLGILNPGECFGEMSLLTGDPCSATIRARDEKVKAMIITKEDFDIVLSRNPVLNRYFSKLLALRLNKMSKQFTDHATGAVTGELHMIGPTELIQAITVTDRTGNLSIQQGNKEIDLLFHSGQIWRVEVSNFPEGTDPEEAFYAFLAWDRGRFSFEPSEEPPSPDERSFFKDTTSLLLEAMRRLDESHEE